MLNAAQKTLPLIKNVLTFGAICMIFDTMGVLPVLLNYEILKIQE
jgi:hypothetical protein